LTVQVVPAAVSQQAPVGIAEVQAPTGQVVSTESVPPSALQPVLVSRSQRPSVKQQRRSVGPQKSPDPQVRLALNSPAIQPAVH
jgi:hypothetical protein